MSLAEALSTVEKTATANVIPKGFDSPGTVDYANGTGTITSHAPLHSEDYRKEFEEATGMPVPAGQDVVLERATLQKSTASGFERWWYKFKFVPKPLSEETAERPSLVEMAQWAKSQRPRKVKTAAGAFAIITVADLQIGKTDRHGGTPETVAGFMRGIELAKAYIKRHKIRRVCLYEAGDGIENFQNTPKQAQTNDRELVEQLDIHTTLILHAVTELAKICDELIVVGVPSNHMEVREDGKAVGGVHNDYGLLSLANVKRAVSLNPKAYGHVKFAWPDDHEVSLTIDLAGVPVGFAHGHYSRGAGAADGVPKWLAGQFAGNHPLQPAKVIITGHFHHLRYQNIIGGRWWFQGPTLDRGSAWLEHGSGEGSSENGILAMLVGGEYGLWDHAQLLRTEV